MQKSFESAQYWLRWSSFTPNLLEALFAQNARFLIPKQEASLTSPITEAGSRLGTGSKKNSNLSWDVGTFKIHYHTGTWMGGGDKGVLEPPTQPRKKSFNLFTE